MAAGEKVIPEITVGNQTYKLMDETAREHLVEVKSTTPTSEDNRLWIKEMSAAEEEANTYEVPTIDEFNDLESALKATNVQTNKIAEDVGELTGTERFVLYFERGQYNGTTILSSDTIIYSERLPAGHYYFSVTDNNVLFSVWKAPLEGTGSVHYNFRNANSDNTFTDPIIIMLKYNNSATLTSADIVYLQKVFNVVQKDDGIIEQLQSNANEMIGILNANANYANKAFQQISEMTGEHDFAVFFTRGEWGSSGASQNKKVIYSELIPAGTYDFSVSDNSVFFSVWKVTSGGSVVHYSYNNVDRNATFTDPIRINLKYSDNRDITSSDIAYLQNAFVLSAKSEDIFGKTVDNVALHSDRINGIQQTITGRDYIEMNLEKGIFSNNGYADNSVYAHSQVYPAGDYIFENNSGSDFLYSVYTYNSASSGTVVYSDRVNNAYRKMTDPFVVNVRYKDGLAISDEKIQNARKLIRVSTPSSKNLNVLCLGDSIFGNVRDQTGVVFTISSKMPCTAYNGAVGGSHISERAPSGLDAFSGHSLADAICSDDWDWQEESVSTEGLPSYINDVLTILEGIDYSTIDIITIAYGTNDYTDGVATDNQNNPYDTTTICGALRYMIKKFHETYPAIKIAVFTPLWRYFDNDDSDTATFGYDTLKQIASKIVDAANDMRVPVFYSYRNMQLDSNTATTYMVDKTHLNEAGRAMYGRMLGDFLKMFTGN